jgi:hypothetical protein
MSGLLRGIWEFFIGDDWRIAFGVAIAVALTRWLVGEHHDTWWLPALAALVLLAWSVLQVARRARPTPN